LLVEPLSVRQSTGGCRGLGSSAVTQESSSIQNMYSKIIKLQGPGQRGPRWVVRPPRRLSGRGAIDSVSPARRRFGPRRSSGDAPRPACATPHARAPSTGCGACLPRAAGAQTNKSSPRRVGGASRSSCRVLCAQVQPVITWGSCPRGRGSRWRSWRSTPPRKQAGRAQTHRRRVRATASTERTSSTVRRPAQLTSPAAIDPALPPPRRADTRRSVEDGGDGKERQAGCGRAAVDCGRRRRSGEWRARCDAPAAALARRPRPRRPHRRHPHLRARRRPRRRRPRRRRPL
jgi:hypothetical protein